MCRWITLLSSETVSLSDIVLTPSNSLIQLAKDASYHPGYDEMNNHVTNGDGFGVGWYHSNHTACHGNPNQDNEKADEHCLKASFFKDTQPAWNNLNLREICMAVQSSCIIAHVRAASAFAGISQQNCHPFKAGRLLFCHNGRIEQFDRIRRRMHSELSDEAFLNVKGTTDSEIIFFFFLTYLSMDPEYGSALTQTEPFGHKRLSAALKKVLRSIERILEDVGIDTGFSTCNFSLTDGETVVVTRFCDKSPNVPPPSLYFAFGDAKKLHQELTQEEPQVQPMYRTQASTVSESSSHGDTNMSDTGSDSDFDEKQVDTGFFESKPGTIYADIDQSSASFIVASCPLTRTHAWHPMPKNSIMWYTRGSLPELRILKRRKTTQSYI